MTLISNDVYISKPEGMIYLLQDRFLDVLHNNFWDDNRWWRSHWCCFDMFMDMSTIFEKLALNDDLIISTNSLVPSLVVLKISSFSSIKDLTDSKAKFIGMEVNWALTSKETSMWELGMIITFLLLRKCFWAFEVLCQKRVSIVLILIYQCYRSGRHYWSDGISNIVDFDETIEEWSRTWVCE